MDIIERRRKTRIVDACIRYPEFSKKLGLMNLSTFHGVQVDDFGNDPLSNTKKPA